ncbi:MAG: TonB-dependent receptor [Gallionella sp.]
MKQQKLLAAILCAATSLACATEENTPLDLLIVTGTRIEQPLKQSLSHTTVITRKEIEESQAVDVASVLKNLAGVEFYQSGGTGKQSSLFLRGTNSSHVLVLLDGVRINSATTGATAIDQLMLDQVDHIEVVRGSVSSLYGSEAIGGVIQIFTKRGKGEPAFNVSGGVESHNTQRLAAGFGGEAGSTAFNVQVSKFKTAGVSAIKPGIVPTVNPDNDGYDNTSLSGNVRHAFNLDNSLTASVFQSRGDVQYDNAFALATTDVNTSKSTLSKFAVISDNRFSDTWQSKLQLARGTDEYKDYLNGMQSSAIKTDNRQIGWQNTLAVSAFGSVLLGLENLNQQVTSTTAYTQTTRKVNSLFAGYTGNYIAHQVQANLRQDRYSDFGAANTGLLGYGYAMNDAWRVTASISTAFKAPTFNDLYGPTGWGSNPDLRPERSRNIEIGLHYAADGQRVDAVYFDNRIRNLIEADSTWTMQNLSATRSDGIELSYAGQFGDTGVKAALTSQNPRDANTGQALLRRAKLFANLGMTQQLGNWKVGGEWQYSGTREDYDINTFARTTLDSYNVVNITAHHDLSKQLKLALRADNLFNRDYMLAHGYNTLGRTLFVGLSYQQ